MKVLVVAKGVHGGSGGAETVGRNWYFHISRRTDTILLTDNTSRTEHLRQGRASILFARHPASFLEYGIRTTRKLKQICKVEKPDLIHIHSYAGFIAIPPEIPTIVTLQDEPFVDYFDFVSNRSAGTILSYLGKSRSFMRNLLLSRTSYVHAVSNTIVQQLKTKYPGIKSKVIPNPPNTPKPGPPTISREHLLATLGIPSNSKIILSVGNLAFRKGYHILLDAAEILKDRQDLHFIVVGKTLNLLFRSYQMALQGRIVREGLSNFHLLGFVSNELLHNLFSHADVYVSAAISEACSLALLDAASYKVPIIATDVGAARDLFEGEAQIIPRFCNGTDISRAIITSSNHTRQAYSITKKYTWDTVTDSLIEFYNNILDGN